MIIGFIGTSSNPTVSSIRTFVYSTYKKVINEINKVDIDIKTVDNTVVDYQNENEQIKINNIIIKDTIIYNNNGEINNDDKFYNKKVEKNIERSYIIAQPAERILGYVEKHQTTK